VFLARATPIQNRLSSAVPLDDSGRERARWVWHKWQPIYRPNSSTFECTRLDPAPAVRGFCAGYELGRWRNDHFAAHLMNWLPDFALKHSEVEAIGAHNAVEVVARAARSIYKSEKYQKRGELGEIMLHAIVRQTFSTVPGATFIPGGTLRPGTGVGARGA